MSELIAGDSCCFAVRLGDPPVARLVAGRVERVYRDADGAAIVQVWADAVLVGGHGGVAALVAVARTGVLAPPNQWPADTIAIPDNIPDAGSEGYVSAQELAAAGAEPILSGACGIFCDTTWSAPQPAAASVLSPLMMETVETLSTRQVVQAAQLDRILKLLESSSVMAPGPSGWFSQPWPVQATPPAPALGATLGSTVPGSALGAAQSGLGAFAQLYAEDGSGPLPPEEQALVDLVSGTPAMTGGGGASGPAGNAAAAWGHPLTAVQPHAPLPVAGVATSSGHGAPVAPGTTPLQTSPFGTHLVAHSPACGTGIGGAVVSLAAPPAESRFLAELWGEEAQHVGSGIPGPPGGTPDMSGPALPASFPGASPSEQCQLEMLRILRAMRKDRDGADSEESAADAEALLEEHGALSAEAKKLRGMRRLRRSFEKHPERMVTAYVHFVRGRLGVHGAASWHMTDYAKALRGQFGRHVGLWRVLHYLLSALNLGALEGKPLAALALVGQVCKALHQAALNLGSWEIATLFIPLPDPAKPPQFSGTWEEMSAAANYREGMVTLKSAGFQPSGVEKAEAGADEPTGDGSEGRTETRAKAKAAAVARKAAAAAAADPAAAPKR